MKKLNQKAVKRFVKEYCKPFDLFLYILFSFVIVITLYPFLNVLAMSLNDSLDTIKGMNFIIPRKFTLENYKKIFTEEKLLGPFGMSVLRTVVGTICSVLSTSMLAYVFSRRDFCLNKFVTIMFVFTMYVGGGLVPEYLLIRQVGLMGKFSVYIIPGLVGVYNIILMRSFMDGLPDALQESAMIDGANDFIIFRKIIMPLCKPVVATVALFVAVGQWNSFMDTYFYMGGSKWLTTLQYKLYEILNQTGNTVNNIHDATSSVAATSPQSIRMAITVIATVPIIIVYPFVQKYFVGGMTLGAVKN